MTDLTALKYDKPRNWIREAAEKGKSWEQIKLMLKESEDELRSVLNRRIEEDFWPTDLTPDIWYALVEREEQAYKEKLELKIRQDQAMLTEDYADNDAQASIDKHSSWQLYKQMLLQEQKWQKESVDELEETTLKILRRLKLETKPGEAVKGLVVGHVQSGKTANMAALMAMAADNGWNMFIVLSGTIENLRQQTQRRLFHDLHRHGNLMWTSLEHLSLHSPDGQKLQHLDLRDGSKHRYFTVCLKNPTRLENLMKWMHADRNKLAQLKIIVIDDESDQAGINTHRAKDTQRAKEMRSRINQLLVYLVEGRRYNGEPLDAAPRAMNYIGYTATPYANFLNESAPESLYPRDFIRTLTPSKEYFGPKQIFGSDESGEYRELDIVRTIDKKEVEQIKLIHSGESHRLPASAEDALAWFLCAVSAMRYSGYRKAISMLVHTSQKQIHHSELAESIEKWLKQTPEVILEKCRSVWNYETNRFSPSAFRRQFPEYPNLNNIGEYPSFDDIKEGIELLLQELTAIPLDEDQQLRYHAGIHLCIDNCANNGISDENMFVRLAYPDPHGESYPSPAPAFIVVGGSTLSRGLTIEGLVSTLFLRASNQADTLMQMGRWFGYRRGYELYPRIWMTEDTQDKFKFLAQLEQDLRDDLRRYMDAGAKPSEYGPRINASPKVSWLRITAPNRMQGAVEAVMDFSGTSAQTVVFTEDPTVLRRNIEVTEAFLESLGSGELSHTENSVIWRNIPFEVIKNGLLVGKYEFHERASVFNHIEAFCQWYEESAPEANYTGWNIVAAGTKVSSEEKMWVIPGGRVGKINRSRLDKKTHDGSLSIGVLRAPRDLYEDLQPGILTDEELNSLSKSANSEAVRKARERAGFELTPLLLIYRIDKDSKAPEKAENEKTPPRKDLNVQEDIIGLAMWIPGVKAKQLVKKVTVKITHEDMDRDDETGDSGED